MQGSAYSPRYVAAPRLETTIYPRGAHGFAGRLTSKRAADPELRGIISATATAGIFMFTAIRDFNRWFDKVSLTERAGFLLLLILVVAAPIPYGAVLPGGILRLQLLCFLTAAIAVLGHRGSSRLPLASIFAIAAIALVGAFQLLPLPEDLLTRLSPSSAEVYRDTNEILRSYGRPEIPARISIVPVETVKATLLVLSYVCAFLAGTLLTRTRDQRNILVAVFLANCVAHVVYASFPEDDLPWRSGTFVNQNHFAGYLEMGLAFAFAMFWLEIVRARRGKHGEDGADAIERRLVGVAIRIVAWAAIGAGIVFTRSRMGIAAPIATTVILLGLALVHRQARRRSVGRGLAAIAGLAGGAALILITTGRLPFLRFLITDPRDPASELRLQLWRLSVDAWNQFPHFGSGLGTFREAFRAVQDQELTFLVEQAHNDTLQLLVTGGWVSTALAVMGIGSFGILLFRRWWRQSRSAEAAFALGAIGALTSLLLHGLVEFNFSIPAIPATLAVLLGAGWSAANDEGLPSRRSR